MVFLTSCSQETEEEERVVGYMGKARKNPYLAAERYLEADGKTVKSSSGALKLDFSQGTLFAPASSIRSVGDAERILEWVADGGHLVCFLERGEEYWRDVGNYTDHSPEHWSEIDDDESPDAGLVTMLEALGLGVSYLENEPDVEGLEDSEVAGDADEEDSKEDSGELSDEEKAERLQVAKGQILPNTEELEIYISDTESYIVFLGGAQTITSMDDLYYEGDWYDVADDHYFFSRLYGYDESGLEAMGRVTLLSDARLFRNPYLGYAEHAELLDALVLGGENVEFSLGKVRSFTSMLGEYASKALWAFLVLTVIWLWKNLPGFGPLLEVSEGHSRNYSEHVQQVGRFFWRQNRSDVLLESLRAAVARKAGHAFSGNQDSVSLIEKISQMSGLDHDLIKEAMELKTVKDSSTMVRITKTLQTILKQL
ncbi:DUF4350 domain-containing protein [Rubritalea sp.]|uniref:DUF4350 domain-containing protein n=1 Tax=Rubritalea sp. TaxID=2109375 RepID=UPI003EF5A021